MGVTMGLNLLLLLAMVATNIFSLYHLSSTIKPPPISQPTSVPDHLIHQLQTIRAAISHHLRHQSTTTTTDTISNEIKSTIPSDLLLYSKLSPIASSCHNHPDLLHKYMNYVPYSLCPLDSELSETLILHGCHPLPRRRCFARTPAKPPNLSSSLSDSAVIWSSPKFLCRSFKCLAQSNPNLGFNPTHELSRFITNKTELDLPIQQLFEIAKSLNSVIRLGIDIGGGTGTLAAKMKEQNVTIVTTTMNVNAPYNEAVALRGLIPLHVPLQQRLPVFDGVVDVVRCGRAVNRWIPVTMMEFLLYDVDRVLRGGGFLWIDHFFGKEVDVENVYTPLIKKLGYKKVKWATANKLDSKIGEVYLTALLQKPVSR